MYIRFSMCLQLFAARHIVKEFEGFFYEVRGHITRRITSYFGNFSAVRTFTSSQNAVTERTILYRCTTPSLSKMGPKIPRQFSGGVRYFSILCIYSIVYKKSMIVSKATVALILNLIARVEAFPPNQFFNAVIGTTYTPSSR